MFGYSVGAKAGFKNEDKVSQSEANVENTKRMTITYNVSFTTPPRGSNLIISFLGLSSNLTKIACNSPTNARKLSSTLKTKHLSRLLNLNLARLLLTGP